MLPSMAAELAQPAAAPAMENTRKFAAIPSGLTV
jgi:hypothetical protein